MHSGGPARPDPTRTRPPDMKGGRTFLDICLGPAMMSCAGLKGELTFVGGFTAILKGDWTFLGGRYDELWWIERGIDICWGFYNYIVRGLDIFGGLAVMSCAGLKGELTFVGGFMVILKGDWTFLGGWLW